MPRLASLFLPDLPIDRIRRRERHEERRDFSSPGFPGEGDHAKHGGGVLRPQETPPPAFSRFPSPANAGEDLWAVRLGRRMVKSLANADAARIVAARSERPFDSVEDVWRRSGVPVAALEKLADADAFAGFGHDRRQALWEVRGLPLEIPLPLLEHAGTEEAGAEQEMCLVYLVPDGGRVRDLVFEPTEGYDPITWTGDVEEPVRPRKGANKRGRG